MIYVSSRKQLNYLKPTTLGYVIHLPFCTSNLAFDHVTLIFFFTSDFQTTDMKEIAVRIARFPKENGKKGRIVVFTQGPDPTIIVQG